MDQKEGKPLIKSNFNLHGHELALFISNSILSIEIETSSPGAKLFHAQITDSDAEKLAKIHNSAQGIYELLIDALSGSHSNIKVWFTEDATLNYISEFEIGKIKSKLAFSIPMKEVEREPLSVLELKVRKMNQTIEVQEKKIKEMEEKCRTRECENDLKFKELEEMLKQEKKIHSNEIQVLKDELKAIQSKLGNLNLSEGKEDKKYSQAEEEKAITFYFDKESINKEFYEYKDDYRTVRCKSNGKYKFLLTDKPISKTKVCKISYKVQSLKYEGRGMMFGITYSNFKDHTGEYPSDKTYFTALYNMSYIYPEVRNAQTCDELNDGSLVTLIADLPNKTVTWDHNHKRINSDVLDEKSIEQYDCYFVLLLSDTDDCVSIVDE